MKKYLILPSLILVVSLNAQKFISISKNNNEFAFKLFKELSAVQPDQNIFFSPFSISTALAMTYAGARHVTELQMSKTLCFDIDQQQFHRDYKSLLSEIKKNTEGSVELNFANSLWAQKSFYFLDSYFALVNSTYDSKLNYVDFIPLNERKEAVKEINNWVDSTTRQKISSILKNDDVDSSTRLILVNAIYFYGEWAARFKKENTRDSTFYISKNKSVRFPFMNLTDTFKYYEGAGFKALEIPYKEKKISLIIILPDEIEGIKNVEDMLDPGFLSKINENFKPKKTKLMMPKIKTEGCFDLSNTLIKMGMHDPFSYSADFSGMTGKDNLYISKVIHKAVIEVSEEGTVAAAATAVVMDLKTSMVKPDIKTFNIDHPFLLLIKENATGSILFMGKIDNPKE